MSIRTKAKKKLRLSVKRRWFSSGALVAAMVALLGIAALVSSHADTALVSVEAESGTLVSGGAASKVDHTGASGGQAVTFGLFVDPQPMPSADKPCGLSAPAGGWKHVVWIWEENKDQSDVIGNAPYIDSLAAKCAALTNVQDNATTPDLPSQPQYIAATAGSNCNKGITSGSSSSGGSGCITDNSDGRTVSSTSIFQLVKDSGGSWKSYQESMPANCASSSSGPYAYKHNPAAAFTQIRSDCASLDVPIPAIKCSASSCAAPTGSFAEDIKAGTLPTFAFVTPDLNNDMHDGSVQQGDSWLKTYMNLIFDSPNYRAGDTAVFIMWDEGSSNDSGVKTIPTVLAAPSIPAGTKLTTKLNNIGLLKTTQEMLNLTPLLGCASGTPPGGTGTCNAGSDVSVRAALHL